MNDAAEQVLADPVNRTIWDLRIRARQPAQAVADEVGLSRGQVWRRLQKILDAVPSIAADEVTTYRKAELVKLEENEAIVYEALLSCPVTDHLGISRLTGALTRVMEQRAKLIGLYAPKRVQVEGLQTSPLEWMFGEIDAELERGLRRAEDHANETAEV